MISDINIAFRSLTRMPGFALAFILTLGLGIGANTAIFSVINGVLLRPLPYPEADRIMRLRQNRKTLWENYIDVAPILGAYGAFTGPVGRIVQMIGDMRGPKAGDVAIKEIALDRLA